LGENDPGECAFEELIEPGLGDFEAELIIEGVGGGFEEAGWLAEEADEAAFVEETFGLATNAGTVHFEDQSDDTFESGEGENDAKRARRVDIGLGQAEPDGDLGESTGEADGRAEEHVAGAWPDEERAPEPCEVGGVATEHEQREGEHGEHGHGDGGFLDRGRRGSIDAGPDQIGATGLDQEEEDGEDRDHPAIELFAGFLGGETFAITTGEESGSSFGFDQLVVVEFFELFAGAQPHLEVAHQGDEESEDEEDDGGFACGGVGVAADGGDGDPGGQEQEPVDQSNPLNIAVHVW